MSHCGGSRWWLVGALLAAASGPDAVHAQDADTVRVYEIDPLVVTAERMKAPLATSTAAVSRISSEELRALPVRTVAEALETVPGLTFLDVDGLGLDPQLAVRGFYGGGEAEYVVVLLDGVPLNGPEAGLVDWGMIPISALESIEVLRGGASSLYGDAAVGGVINLVTAGGGRPGLNASAKAGELGMLRVSVEGGSEWEGRPVSAWGALQRADGFREHAERAAGSVGASVGLVETTDRDLSLSTLHGWREQEKPGPLTASELAEARTGVHPFYRFDETEERLHRLALHARQTLGSAVEASGYLVAELRARESVRTLPLSAEFVDTKERVLGSVRLLGSAQLRWSGEALPGAGALLLGADWSAARLRNEYYQVLSGGADVYRQAPGERGELDARGAGSRLAMGAFARYELRPIDALRFTAGTRLDWLSDSFRPEAPESAGALEGTHLALSPQAGVNFRFLQTATQEGHLYASVGRSFKAPTPDQLFDQRSIPVPFEPYGVTLSNAELDPQRGVSVETGLYHRARLLPDALAASVSLSVYQLDMRDELDVDLQTFRYVNIGRSRHRGAEAGLELDGPGGLGAHGSYTLQAVTFRYGEHHGNALKAIPRHSLGLGLRVGAAGGVAGAVMTQSAWGVHLDDANTIELPGYTRVDARLSFPIAGARLVAEVFNLLDREYSTTGYPDPGGSGRIYYYPAAKRVLQVGLSTPR